MNFIYLQTSFHLEEIGSDDDNDDAQDAPPQNAPAQAPGKEIIKVLLCLPENYFQNLSIKEKHYKNNAIFSNEIDQKILKTMSGIAVKAVSFALINWNFAPILHNHNVFTN